MHAVHVFELVAEPLQSTKLFEQLLAHLARVFDEWINHDLVSEWFGESVLAGWIRARPAAVLAGFV